MDMLPPLLTALCMLSAVSVQFADLLLGNHGDHMLRQAVAAALLFAAATTTLTRLILDFGTPTLISLIIEIIALTLAVADISLTRRGGNRGECDGR